MPDINNIAGNTQLGAATAGAAVQGGFGILGSLINYGLNKRLAKIQNQYNIDMWKMQADYNSPQAQMQRFKDAGLNPNLIYGQGSNGNMASPPEQVTPSAPELSHQMMELGKAFNIEQLKTVIANRKKAQADAENAKTNATRNSLELSAERNFGINYTYDYQSGKYVLRTPPAEGTVDVIHPSAYYFNRILEGNFNRSSLIPYRSLLLDAQKRFLEPQILMNQYEQRFKPYSFWIGQGSRVLNALPLPKLNFKFGETPQQRSYNNFYY